MQIAAVAVSATDLSRAVSFYELLGFRFPPLEADTKHIEADWDVRLMIDEAAFLAELHGEPPRAGNTAGFAVLFDAPADVDAAASRVADAGHTVVTAPYDAPWGQRYATVADPDGYRTDLFCVL
ncbi:VOC family protein [Blastococcus sp. CT_GayMR16]|uniref:VOC family protein n=1 Tax=Blastococcus sp. CT_GayMR16 TaxID=2559607 RepID=UPI0010746F6D|nr:VOC family protein [Blastococcus sp. CT_GayMR16]TFV89994.1 glyoxalase [Blastococcus sp. CT_GayMR16]